MNKIETNKDCLNIEVPYGTKIAVFGDVHEHSEQFQKMLAEIQPSRKMWVVSVGDIYDKGFGIKTAEAITEELMSLRNRGIGWAVSGNHEIKHIKKAKKNSTDALAWWRQQPLALSFQFESSARVTVVHAGVTPRHTWEDLKRDIEIVYVRDIDDDGKMIPLIWKDIDGVSTLVKSKTGGNAWHQKYDGRFGYIVSGHAAQKDGEAKFYKFSCNLDSAVYETGILTAQIFEEDGSLGKIIRVKGVAKKPELNIA
jgi:predicted phosphodiesterase